MRYLFAMNSPRPRIFTLSEANALLPQIDQLIAGFLSQKENYSRRHDVLFMEEILNHKEAQSGLPASGELAENEAQELEAFLSEIEKFADQLRGLGCVVRNLEQGWIDFPAKIAGELVYFCWRRGEESIQFYHTPGDSMNERRPLVA
ncbi:MAG: DUF2203 domain-containing protein [Candidatus Omnitrophica bacterium]|nr:DUF2203 domain-containing protein [Candidatus Omnitrophota bacterium]